MTYWKDCTVLRIGESEKLKTVLDLYNMESHQKKAGSDYHQIEDNGEKKYRSRIYETRILRPETEIMKGTPWSRIRGQDSMARGWGPQGMR